MKKLLSKHNIIFISIFTAVLILDQVTKILLKNADFNIIGNFLRFEYVLNLGAAFSMLSGGRWLFIIVTSVISVLLVLFYIFNKNKNIILTISLSLIIAGGMGNLIDRVIFGMVRDFISFSFFPAIFNIADISVTIGTILFCIYIIFFWEKNKKIEKPNN